MTDLISLIAVLPLLAATVYAQRRLPVHAPSAQAWGLRLLLAAVGLGMGVLMADRARYAGAPEPWLAFLLGFGMAHLPAAVILFVKHRRGEYG